MSIKKEAARPLAVTYEVEPTRLPPGGSQRTKDGADGFCLIERVKMQAGRSSGQKFTALLYGELRAQLKRLFRIAGKRRKKVMDLLRNGSPAAFTEIDRILVIGDGKDPGDHARMDP